MGDIGNSASDFTSPQNLGDRGDRKVKAPKITEPGMKMDYQNPSSTDVGERAAMTTGGRQDMDGYDSVGIEKESPMKAKDVSKKRSM